MRSGKWMIASCGIVGLVLAHAAADDRFYGSSRYTFEERNSSRGANDTFFSRPKTVEAASAAEGEPPADAADAQQQPERYSRQKGAAQTGAPKSSAAPRSGVTTAGYTEELKGAAQGGKTASKEKSPAKRDGAPSRQAVVQAGHEETEDASQMRTVNGRRVMRDSNFTHAEFDRKSDDAERNHIQQLSGSEIQQLGGFIEESGKSQLIHAEYGREKGAVERNQIQQVGGSESRFQLVPAVPREQERQQSSSVRGRVEQAGGLNSDIGKSKAIHAEHQRGDGDLERDQIQQVQGTSPLRASSQTRESSKAKTKPSNGGSFQPSDSTTRGTARPKLTNADYQKIPGTKERRSIRLTQKDEREAELPGSDVEQLEIPELPRVEGSANVPPAPSVLSPPSTASRMEPTFSPSAIIAPTKPGDSQTPLVTVQWVKKSDINVGQECQCDLVVKNAGQVNAREIAVDAYFPPSVRLTAANPQPAENADHLSWNIKELAAGEDQVIHLSMIPSKRGELATTAFVRFTGAASNVFHVEEPLLAVSAKGPKEVMVGDPASQEVTVTNPGTGVAHNVAIEAIVPEGLEHARGQKLLMEVGSVGPGESRTVRLALAAVSGGEHAIVIHAKAEGDLEQETTSYVSVIAPSLKVGIDGPGLRYVGRNAVYALTVANDGRADSNNVRVLHKVPEGFNFVRADKGGKYDETNRTISWFVGHLAAGERAELKSELSATQMGSFLHAVGAVSENGARSESELETHVDGSASLVLEIVDLDDPVEVGVETAYEIRVRNDGSIPAKNVGVSCELPGGVELLGAKGPTDHRAENGLIVFKGLGQLDPGKAAIYRVSVRGRVEGNQRVRARLASDSIKEPLIFEEMTKFYGE